ncbi:MAG: Rieske (2Fe-2S) protein, partial [Planctomycetota bacterium]
MGAADTEAMWTAVLALADLPERTLTVVRPRAAGAAGLQIVLWREGQGIRAIDNICPHEGFPMVEGRVNGGDGAAGGCVITCDWHNFKYALDDGACLVPGEDIRTFPVRVVGEQVEVDLTPPDPEPARQAALASMTAGVAARDTGRAGRDLVRLLELETPLERIGAALLRDACERAPWGWTHGHAVTADALDLAERAAGEGGEPGIPLLHAAGSIAEPLVRYPALPALQPDAAKLGATPEEARAEFRAAAEEDRLDTLLPGFLGWLPQLDQAAVEEWITAAVTDHFFSFGHGAIFTQKAFEALDRIGWGEWAAPLLGSLARNLCSSTRHDVLPYWRGYAELEASIAEELPALAETAFHDDGAAPFDEERFRHLAMEEGPRGAFEAVASAVRGGVHPDRIAAACVRTAAHRLLAFDPSQQLRDDTSFGWLGSTHTLTHAHATRELIRRVGSVESLRGLFHSAFFIQQTGRVSIPLAQRTAIQPLDGTPEGLLKLLPNFIRVRDHDGAAAAALGYLAAGGR